MRILHELCSIPTAPFVEHRVYEYVRAFARARKRLRLSTDRFGNRLLQLPGTSRGRRIVFVAHTDHPGFVARRMIEPGTVEADFRGGVLREYVEGAKVRFFDGEEQIAGVVVGTTPDKQRPTYPVRAHVRVAGRRAVPAGAPGMFDVGVGRVRGGKFHSRVCDDLAGAAAALAMLDELHDARPLRATVAVLLTRAEEVGFIGALAAALKPELLRRSDLVVSIECSAVQPFAPQGDGVIVRVGDRTSVFNSSLTYFLTQQAEALVKEAPKSFKYQRALMPGGSCEGTVFDAYGFTTAAACLPLGNYHNMDRQARRIAAEYVDVRDWQNMVKLFVRVARQAHKFDPDLGPLKRRLEKRFNQFRSLLSR